MPAHGINLSIASALSLFCRMDKQFDSNIICFFHLKREKIAQNEIEVELEKTYAFTYSSNKELIDLPAFSFTLFFFLPSTYSLASFIHRER